MRVLGRKTRFANHKNSEPAALAANWPHRTAFSDYNRSSCCSQVPLKTISPSLRASAHRCERFNCSQCKAIALRGVATAARAAHYCSRQAHYCASNLAAQAADAAPRRRRGAAAGLPRLQRLTTTAPRADDPRRGLPVLGARPRWRTRPRPRPGPGPGTRKRRRFREAPRRLGLPEM